MRNNKIVYGWFHNEQIFYVGIGSLQRSKSLHYRNSHCLNKRAKAEREKTFEIRILESGLTFEEACLKEIELIEQYGRIDNETGCLTNQTDGGEGHNYWQGKIGKNHTRFGKTHTEDTKLKISKSKKGQTHTKETIQKMKDSCWLKKGREHPKAKSVVTPLGEFDTLTEAAKAHRRKINSMSRTILNPRITEYYYK